MALIPKFTFSLDNDLLGWTFTENTGVYNSSTNTGGYGTPNLAIGSVASANIVIVNTITGVTYDPIAITASNVVGIQTVILVSTLTIAGNPAGVITVTDGVYSIVYSVLDSVPNTYQTQIYKLFVAYVVCSLQNIASLINITDNCCSNDAQNFLDLYTRYKILTWTPVCQNVVATNKALQDLQGSLRSYNCKNCNNI